MLEVRNARFYLACVRILIKKSTNLQKSMSCETRSCKRTRKGYLPNKCARKTALTLFRLPFKITNALILQTLYFLVTQRVR